jgi:hypothetical protein
MARPVGRPRSNNPKNNLVGVRLSKTDLAHIRSLEEKTGLVPGQVVRLLLRTASVEDLRERMGR